MARRARSDRIQNGSDPVHAFQRYQFAFTRHVRDPSSNPRPPGAEPERMRIYTELLYNNVESFLLACFPVTRKILGKRRWTRLVREFFALHRCHSPLFREIPEEFLGYVEAEREDRPDDPPFLKHLAHYEWVELALDVWDDAEIDPDRIESGGDLLKARPAINPVHMLLTYLYPVHRISPRFKPEAQEITHLLAFRTLDCEIKFDMLNAVSARLIQLLAPGALTGGEAVGQIAAELEHPDPQAVVSGGSEILSTLRLRGAILGTLKEP